LNGKRPNATRFYRFISAPRACLIAGAGFVRFIGGEGRDVFFFDAEGAAWRETIVDFNPEEDRLAFQLEGLSVMEALSLSREETDLILNYGLGSVVLSGQAEAELTEDHFLFV
jgi:Ca2+-binding RTX toxin-like protein